METAARVVAVQAESIEVRAPDDIERALAAAEATHAEAGILLTSPLVYVHMNISSKSANLRYPNASLSFPSLPNFRQLAVSWLMGRTRSSFTEDAGITSGKSCTVPRRVTCRYN